MIFLRLPIELHLMIIGYLGPIDIFHVQLTCTALNGLIEDSSEHVWRHCLRRHIIRNDLFAPSFAHLTTAAELRHAATAPLRFASAYREAVASNSPISKTTKVLNFPANDMKDTKEDIMEMYLIPGGRFLLTFKQTSMSLWDIRSAPNVELSISTEIGAFNSMLPGRRVFHYRFLELRWTAEHTFTVHHLGSLALVHNLEISMQSLQSLSIAGSRIIILLGDTTVVWDYQRNSYTGWRLMGVSSPSELFSNDRYVLYLTNEGIHGVSFLDFNPIAGGYVKMDTLFAHLESPVFSVYFKEGPYDLIGNTLLPNKVWVSDSDIPIDGETDLNIYIRESSFTLKVDRESEALPSQLRPDGRWEQELPGGYDIDHFADDKLYGTLHVHRYTFSYCPSTPATSALTRVSTTKHTMPPMRNSRYYSAECYAVRYFSAPFYQKCDGPENAVTLWSDGGDEVFFGEGAKPVFLSFVDDRAEGSNKQAMIVPFINPRQFVTQSWVVESEVCPASAKGVVMWEDDAHDIPVQDGALGVWLELYEIGRIA
ncbi:hypothetical protein DFP72DRAFT_1102080 [Ephemerocybe angulata]|uniref:F-box domain-containing protein n=1 Tax=Ephemerocybe angulata TaxID=980116 RepID=A0A8H6LTE8_9AGAR|nr:hypothetical protein DFP72DRAFT_1102080 [Tulosesus angulatus]